MLVIKTHYCLPFRRAVVIVCLIAVTFGINLLVGLVPLQNSFAQDIGAVPGDTNGDGVVNASLDPLKVRTLCNGDFFTPDSIIRGGQTDARW